MKDRRPSRFFIFMNLALDLLLCQEGQDKNMRSSVCILRTRIREMMNESRISGAVVVAASSFTVWGFNVNMCCGHF